MCAREADQVLAEIQQMEFGENAEDFGLSRIAHLAEILTR